MNKNSRKIYDLILATLDMVGMDLDVKHEQSGINMSYNFILHYIGFDVKRIMSAVKELQPDISLEDYVRTFSLHESGHAIDRKALLASMARTIEIFNMKQQYSLEERYSNVHLLSVLIEEHQMNIQFENTAWANAEKLNEKFGIVDWKTFHYLKSQGLKTYFDSYKNDLILYGRLIQDQSTQIA